MMSINGDTSAVDFRSRFIYIGHVSSETLERIPAMKEPMKRFILVSAGAIVSSVALMTFSCGCSGSGEASKDLSPTESLQPSATETFQKEMGNLKAENDSLKRQLTKLQEYNRSVVARSAEMETQLAELKDKNAMPPEPPTHPAVPPHSVSPNLRPEYDNGLALFRSRKYAEAAAIFQQLLDAGTAGRLESNCHYWLGECSYGAKKFKDAITHFTTVFGYSRTTKKDDAQIMIANCYLALGNSAEAKAEFQKLLEKYPASPYAKIAKAKLGRL